MSRRHCWKSPMLEILYPYGALNKLFGSIVEVDFSIGAANLARSGRMYKIKKENATWQWFL